MRIFKGLEMVEQLGSGVPRILESYGKESFRFMDNFTRMTFPTLEKIAEGTEQVTPQVTPQVKSLLKGFTGEHNRIELQEQLNLSDRKYFRENYLLPALDAQFIEMTIPDKPNSSNQKYRLTERGKQLLSR